mmetsp:Transcript_2773/g.7816  ORF Transcript_2773/g.7816 Transcript_2773/m.7816 type:complete len:294 (+) Transcript_2773:254-1135(+)
MGWPRMSLTHLPFRWANKSSNSVRKKRCQSFEPLWAPAPTRRPCKRFSPRRAPGPTMHHMSRSAHMLDQLRLLASHFSNSGVCIKSCMSSFAINPVPPKPLTDIKRFVASFQERLRWAILAIELHALQRGSRFRRTVKYSAFALSSSLAFRSTVRQVRGGRYASEKFERPRLQLLNAAWTAGCISMAPQSWMCHKKPTCSANSTVPKDLQSAWLNTISFANRFLSVPGWSHLAAAPRLKRRTTRVMRSSRRLTLVNFVVRIHVKSGSSGYHSSVGNFKTSRRTRISSRWRMKR